MSLRAALERKAKAQFNSDKLKKSVSPAHAREARQDEEKETFSRFDMLWAAMESDLQALKAIDDLEAKRKFKQSSLDENGFVEYFDEEIKTLHSSNRLMRWIFIWLADVGEWKRVIHAMTRMIDTQKEPVTFKSNWVSFLCHQMDDYARQKITSIEENGRLEQDDIYENLCAFCEALINYRHVSPTSFEQCKEVALAKPFALAAKAALVYSDTTKALRYATFANDVNDRSGVKKIIDAARRQLGY